MESVYLGPTEAMVAADVVVDCSDVPATLERVRAAVKDETPFIRRLYLTPVRNLRDDVAVRRVAPRRRDRRECQAAQARHHERIATRREDSSLKVRGIGSSRIKEAPVGRRRRPPVRVLQAPASEARSQPRRSRAIAGSSVIRLRRARYQIRSPSNGPVTGDVSTTPSPAQQPHARRRTGGGRKSSPSWFRRSSISFSPSFHANLSKDVERSLPTRRTTAV